ncbi:MAG: hypothetical protein HKN41_01290 [Ilumatobacter sp.]|nr:hypothetical protein [Ilumatobacter sp.]
MNRFEETLQRDLRQIADRATPSPDAWDVIQARIDDQDPIQETEIIMLTDNTTETRRLRPPTDTKRRWPVFAAAAAVVVLAIGAIAVVNRDDAEQPADVPPPTVAPAPDPTPETVSDASPLPAEGEALPPGRYAPFTLGLPVTFEVPAATASPWTVQVSNPVTINVGNADGFVVLTRVGSLYDAEQAQTPGMTGLGSIPPDDVDGWIEANGVVVSERREETVGGRPATFVQVTAPAGAGDTTESCPVEQRPCLSVGSASADLQDTYDGVSMALFGANTHSFWFVELDDFEPLAIWSSAVVADPDDWFAEMSPMIDSIEFGDPAPATEFGQARLSTFGAAAESTALALPPPGGTIEPGRYTSDALGVPVEFDLDVARTAAWGLLNEEAGRLWINSKDSDQEFLAFGRLGSWYDATEARTADISGLGSIPPDDIDSWIARNDIIVVGSGDVEVGGRPAAFRQFRLDTTPGATGDFCNGSEPCLWAATGSPDVVGGTANPLEVGFDRVQTIWLVDMDEFEPVYILAAAHLGEDGDQQWIDDIVQPIVDSIVFGEPAPVVPGGTARVPERVTLRSTMTGTRTEGPQAEDGSFPVESVSTLEGDLTGELVSSGTRTGNEIVEESLFTGEVTGFGSGTLTFATTTEVGAFGEVTITSVISDGTGELDGLVGSAETSITGDAEPSGPFTASFVLELLVPRSG